MNMDQPKRLSAAVSTKWRRTIPLREKCRSAGPSQIRSFTFSEGICSPSRLVFLESFTLAVPVSRGVIAIVRISPPNGLFQTHLRDTQANACTQPEILHAIAP